MTCPHVTELREFLEGPVPATPELEAHIESCPVCQETLTRLVEEAIPAVGHGATLPDRGVLPAPRSIARAPLAKGIEAAATTSTFLEYLKDHPPNLDVSAKTPS